jgi:hypothetical protein
LPFKCNLQRYIGDLLARYGAVKATPRNCFKLIEAGLCTLESS